MTSEPTQPPTELPTEAFTLDRHRLADEFDADEEHDSDQASIPANDDAGDTGLGGIRSDLDGGLAAAIVSYFDDAHDCGAIGGIPDVQVVVYAVGFDSVLIAVRERDTDFSVAVPQRQVARWSIETSDLMEFGNDSFDEACAALEEILRLASGLLPTLRAMQLLEGQHAHVAEALHTHGNAPLAERVATIGAALARRER
jgi:hypothetical protein